MPPVRVAKARLSATVSSSNKPMDCGTKPRCCHGIRPIGTSGSNEPGVTLPVSGVSQPPAIISSVLLPEPEGPVKATSSPGWSAKLIGRRTWVPP